MTTHEDRLAIARSVALAVLIAAVILFVGFYRA